GNRNGLEACLEVAKKQDQGVDLRGPCRPFARQVPRPARRALQPRVMTTGTYLDAGELLWAELLQGRARAGVGEAGLRQRVERGRQRGAEPEERAASRGQDQQGQGGLEVHRGISQLSVVSCQLQAVRRPSPADYGQLTTDNC